MANKTKREEARTKRVAAEAKAAGEERRRRLIALSAAAVLLAGVLVAVLIAVSQSGSDSSGDTTDIQSADTVNKELSGIRQDGTVLGDAAAPVSIVEYGDLQCPICGAFANGVGTDLITGPVSDGQTTYELKQWVIIGPDSDTAAKAALAAAKQGRYWNFVELFYANQGQENSGYVTDDFLTAVAKGAGVPDIGQWNQDRASSEFDQELRANDAAAGALGFSGTPSFVVKGPGGKKLLGAPPSAAQLQAAINAVS